MGQVNLKFKPSVPVFDANVALGRRHDRRVVVDTTAGTLEAMKKSGVERALASGPSRMTTARRNRATWIRSARGSRSAAFAGTKSESNSSER